ncbi:uncharacterized protein LOC119988574 [Tripterygium wilfordii]|nr:uncharacterized protein LOC119988574 [Tripterygium wilfordii]
MVTLCLPWLHHPNQNPIPVSSSTSKPMLWVFELLLGWMGIRSSSAAETSTMEVNSSPIDGKAQEAVLDELIEQNWFFENLFNRTREKKVMLRCYSDPSSCPNSSKCPDGGAEPPKGLIRAPSLPPNVGREEGGGVKEKKGRKLIRQASLQATTTNQVKTKERVIDQAKKGEARRSESSRHSLLRTPSLPHNVGRTDVIEEEEDDDESEYRMSNLIQQALPRRNTMKVMTQSGTNGANEMRNRFLMNQKKTRKSLIELEIEEVEGFKELGFNFDGEDLTPGVVNLVPGLKEKKKEHLHQNNNVRRPYLSEAWFVQSPAPPPIPNCIPKKSADDVKKQIKFWARAVASHVR